MRTATARHAELMTPDEWIEIVRWVESCYDRGWSVDVAAKYGAELRQAEASSVCDAIKLCETLPTLGQIKGLMRRSSDRFRPAIEESHRRLFPGGCAVADCDLCHPVVDSTG